MVEEDGPACRCGAFGCLEAVAGTPALLSRAAAIGLPCQDIGDVIRLARHGEGKAAALIESAGDRLGVAIASISNMINPGCVVVGGGLAEAGELLLKPLRRTLYQRGLAAAVEHVQIMPGQLGAEVVAIGAVSIVVQHAFRVPAMARVSNDVAQVTVLT
jgi:predicted NBD/HSP70 family sugar kinase